MLTMPQGVRDDIVDHARDGTPQEVCGVLAGDRNDNQSTVRVARKVPNAASAPRVTYEIDPEILLAVIEDIEAAQMDVVGFYHSHPEGPSRPSQTDVAQATWDGYSYVIVSFNGEPSVGSWRWCDGEFHHEPVTVE